MNFRVLDTESFSVSSPENDNFVEVVLCLEISDILSDLVKMFKFILSRKSIINSVFLISSNEIRIIYGWEGNKIFHVRVEFILKIEVKYLGSFHRISQI